MLSDYSQFVKIYTDKEQNGLESAVSSFIPWYSNNFTWATAALAFLTILILHYFRNTQKVAVSDSELMQKYLLLRTKCVEKKAK